MKLIVSQLNVRFILLWKVQDFFLKSQTATLINIASISITKSVKQRERDKSHTLFFPKIIWILPSMFIPNASTSSASILRLLLTRNLFKGNNRRLRIKEILLRITTFKMCLRKCVWPIKLFKNSKMKYILSMLM